MVEAGSIWVRLGLRTEEFLQGMDRVKVGMTRWRDETNQGSRDLLKWGAALSATVAPYVAVGTAMYMAAEKYGTMANNLRDLSYQTGVNTSQLQRMQYAAVLAGTDFSRVSLGLNQLSLSMAEAQDPTKAAYAAFMGLGIDPRGKTVDEVFDLTSQALVGMRDETGRNQLAMELFGRSWRDLLPYMETYISKSEEIKKHPVLSKENLQTLQDSKIAVDKLKSSFELLTAQIVVTAEKAFNPPGETKLGPTGITEMIGGGKYDEATELMARLYGPLTPDKPLTAKELSTKKGMDMAKDLGLTWKNLSPLQQVELSTGVILDPKLQRMVAGESNRTLNPVTINVQGLIVQDGTDFAQKVQEEMNKYVRNGRLQAGVRT